jgi:transcriptional/translational regulatory protein YebC/TACO1
LEAAIPVESKRWTRIPSNMVDLDIDGVQAVLKLMEELDDHDDVQSVSSNFNASDDGTAKVESE